MSEIVRTVRVDEEEPLERFLERCYGHRRGVLSRNWPELYQLSEERAACCLIVERAGRIVSHVGAFPLEVVLGPARVMTGGVGGVATLPGERGKGHMSRLLEASVDRMRERGWPLSVLWGDQQRYGSFGWETCGLAYSLTINRRALERHGIQPAEVEEVDSRDPQVVDRVRELHATLPFRVERPSLEVQLGRARVFLGPDGYLISANEWAGNLDVLEVVSPTGREPELILGAMDWTFGYSAEVRLGPDEGERQGRLTRVMNDWHLGPQGMFRIIDWPRLLQALRPLLEQRAEGLAPFAACLGCRWKAGVEWATVEWDGAELLTEAVKRGEGIEVELRLLTALLLGGPQAPSSHLGAFGRLLPAPIYIPPFDHV